MNFENKFKAIKKEFNKYDTKKVPRGMAIQVTMSDEDCGGTFYISTVEEKFQVEPFDYVDNTVAIDVFADDFLSLIKGKEKVENLIKNNKISISGNINHLLDLLNNLKEKKVKKATKKTTKKSNKKVTKKAKETVAPKKAIAEKKVIKETPKIVVKETAKETIKKVPTAVSNKKTISKKK